MLTLLILLVALRPSWSLPALFPEGNATYNPAVIAERQSSQGIELPARRRTTEEIVWSSLATVFACTWVAVHPNVPGPNESAFVRFRRHLMMMFYAIIAPELMTLWALRQRSAAARIMREYNQKHFPNAQIETGFRGCIRCIKDWFRSPDDEQRKPWTIAHGFFIQMGGFMFFQNGRPAFVLTFDKLNELIDDGTIDPPSTSEDELFDKSKGDFLTKLLVVVQTTWFVIECVGRWAGELPLTELEVVTLAFAILNIATYALWWQKPQNVQVAIAIERKADRPNLRVGNPARPKVLADRIRGVRGWMVWMVLITLLAPLKLLFGLFSPLGKMAVDNEVPIGSKRAPMCYADYDIMKQFNVVLPALGVSIVFGAIHLIAWNSGTLTTPTEVMLWRLSAITVTVELVPVAIGTALYQLADGRRGGDAVRSAVDACAMSLFSIAVIAMPIYVLARITLLVLAISTLRQLPEKALYDIAWSSFIPHL